MAGPVDIVGIVASSGPRASQKGQGAGAPPDEPWTFRVELVVWRAPDGALIDRSLRLTKTIPDAEMTQVWEDLTAALRSEAIVAVRVNLPSSAVADIETAELVSFIGPVTNDAELSRRLGAIQTEVAFIDAEFGKFVLDRSIPWFTGQVAWRDVLVRVYLDSGALDEARSILSLARHVLSADSEEWRRRIELFAAKKLLELANDWSKSSDDPKIVTVESFVAAITFESVVLRADGSYSLDFNDGDLFWGHWIVVDGTLAEGPSDANIAG